MKKHIVAIVLLLGLVGCTKEPALKVYGLDAPNVGVVDGSRHRTKSIKVTYPQSLKEEISQKMNFSYSSSDIGAYQNSQWSNNMSKLLQGTFIEAIERSKLFKTVLSDSSSVKENYRLESNVFAFNHQVRGTASHALVSIQFILIDADLGRLVKSKIFTYSEVTPTLDAAGYVKATNEAMGKLSRDLLRWLR